MQKIIILGCVIACFLSCKPQNTVVPAPREIEPSVKYFEYFQPPRTIEKINVSETARWDSYVEEINSQLDFQNVPELKFDDYISEECISWKKMASVPAAYSSYSYQVGTEWPNQATTVESIQGNERFMQEVGYTLEMEICAKIKQDILDIEYYTFLPDTFAEDPHFRQNKIIVRPVWCNPLQSGYSGESCVTNPSYQDYFNSLSPSTSTPAAPNCKEGEFKGETYLFCEGPEGPPKRKVIRISNKWCQNLKAFEDITALGHAVILHLRDGRRLRTKDYVVRRESTQCQ